jgi:uncharacterized protein DUF4126
VERLHLLSVALGLAALAGINLYLTVFATGLAIHYHWIILAPAYHSLDVLGDPIVIIVAGALYLVEFFADKIPWVDSAWDAVHTVIRPIGGALLAIQVLGHPSPTMSVIVALLAGGTSLITHTAKTTTRLATNTSPEPFTNVALSFGEDVAVVGGLALIYHNPVAALIVFVLIIAAFVYFAPKILRALKARIWLVLQKLNWPAALNRSSTLPTELPPALSAAFDRDNLLNETIAWAVPCISGRGRRIAANLFGALVATNEEAKKVTFVGRKSGRPFLQTIDLDGALVSHEPKFFSENLLVLPAAGKGPKYLFLFPRSRVAFVEEIAAYLRGRLAAPTIPDHALATPEPVGAPTTE